MRKENIVLELASNRYSAREYSPEPVDIEDVIYAIKVASQAPSGANRQPWRFILVADDDVKKKLRDACEKVEKRFYEENTAAMPEWFKKWAKERGISWSKPFITDAPYLVVVVSKKDEPYHKESTWLAIGYMLLALQEKNLASLTYTPSNPREVAKVLGIPDSYSLEVIIPVGKASKKKKREPRLPLDKLLFLNSWGTLFTNIGSRD